MRPQKLLLASAVHDLSVTASVTLLLHILLLHQRRENACKSERVNNDVDVHVILSKSWWNAAPRPTDEEAKGLRRVIWDADRKETSRLGNFIRIEKKYDGMFLALGKLGTGAAVDF